MTKASLEKEIFPGWLPTQIGKHYGFPLAEATGKGQKIAIISLGGLLDPDELATDFRAMRIPMPDLKITDTDKIPDAQNRKSTSEVHLDVEVIGALCPDAEIGVYRGSNSMEGFAGAIHRAVSDGNHVVSISWEFSERLGVDECEIEMALAFARDKKVTVCCSTGDGGSSNTRSRNKCVPANDKAAHVGYPACSPNVLACGGTELLRYERDSSTGTNPKITTEVAWNNSAIGGGATGGGVSEIFGLPGWQKSSGIDIVSANTAFMGRVTPDVSGLAAYLTGGDWTIYEEGQKRASGGSSAVAPLWASLITLINERRAAASKSALGFMNERLYGLPNKADLFNDIVSGNNRPTASYPGYEAKPGFDACTGWGSPKASTLVEALVNLD